MAKCTRCARKFGYWARYRFHNLNWGRSRKFACPACGALHDWKRSGYGKGVAFTCFILFVVTIIPLFLAGNFLGMVIFLISYLAVFSFISPILAEYSPASPVGPAYTQPKG